LNTRAGIKLQSLSRKGKASMATTRVNSLIILLSVFASSLAFGEHSRICDLAAKRGGLVGYTVQGDAARDGSRTIKVDIDLDGPVDELRWVDPRPGSINPADNATLTLTLTSNRKTFTLQQQRLGVVKFESRFYVVTTRIDSGLGPWYREVFAITQDGITRICSFDGKGQGP
jgi:hypothetical protein